MSVRVVQGGMGVGVSGWRLAQAVARSGGLGVVSATALGTVLARRLLEGDEGGHLRRAMAAYPVPDAAERILDRWYRPGGATQGSPYPQVPMFTMKPTKSLEELNIVANFVEVWLAKQGHDGPIGVNHLTKVQLPVPSGLYGAMLAGVDYVFMGAGIPSHVPHMLDRLSRHDPVDVAVEVEGDDPDDPAVLHFDPARHGIASHTELNRPRFVAIVSSVALATFLARDERTRPDGFVVEAPCAGGHNAPPRGALRLDEEGQPVYGERDKVNYDAMSRLGLPFWLAGGQADRGSVVRALSAGAAGVQIGTAFAFCDESGLAPKIKREVIQKALAGDVDVFTDPLASPSGYPFKVLDVAGTLSDGEQYEQRGRVCDVGMLRTIARRDDGKLVYRCAAEPVEDYVRKGGDRSDTAGRKCLCNALLADVELAQIRDGHPELPLVTAGDDVRDIVRYLESGRESYSATDVIDYVSATS